MIWSSGREFWTGLVKPSLVSGTALTYAGGGASGAAMPLWRGLEEAISRHLGVSQSRFGRETAHSPVAPARRRFRPTRMEQAGTLSGKTAAATRLTQLPCPVVRIREWRFSERAIGTLQNLAGIPVRCIEAPLQAISDVSLIRARLGQAASVVPAMAHCRTRCRPLLQLVRRLRFDRCAHLRVRAVQAGEISDGRSPVHRTRAYCRLAALATMREWTEEGLSADARCAFRPRTDHPGQQQPAHRRPSRDDGPAPDQSAFGPLDPHQANPRSRDHRGNVETSSPCDAARSARRIPTPLSNT
jgi:hypothetical protein